MLQGVFILSFNLRASRTPTRAKGAQPMSTNNRPRVMVDMSATLLHHGHIRLLKKAAEIGDVVVALTVDEEVRKTKGYEPELSYEQRKEILEAIKYVKEVVPSPWLLTEEFMDRHNCRYLVHGADNSNRISKERLLIFPRTEGISSSVMRERVLESLMQMNLADKPGSASEKVARFLIESIKREFRLE